VKVTFIRPALREQYGDELRMEKGAAVTPVGKRFPVRVVGWDEETAMRAQGKGDVVWVVESEVASLDREQ